MATPPASSWAMEYVQERPDFLLPNEDGRVKLVLLTDPWSVWCWGWEPVRRTIETRLPSVDFRPLVGGMFPELPDPARMGFDIERFFLNVHKTTGMPLRLDATSRNRPGSTYPACVHVHAARLLAADRERTYLRALREAAYLDARNVSDPDVAASVAAQVGIDADEFLEALATGEPDREFQDRLTVLHEMGLHAYPTYLVISQGKTTRVEGYQPLPTILSLLEQVSDRVHPLYPAPSALEVVAKDERVATREVAEVLGQSVEETYDELMALQEEDVLERVRHPLGDIWQRV